jgi:hypothetical protein
MMLLVLLVVVEVLVNQELLECLAVVDLVVMGYNIP